MKRFCALRARKGPGFAAGSVERLRSLRSGGMDETIEVRGQRSDVRLRYIPISRRTLSFWVGQPTIGRPFYGQAKGQLWPTCAFYAECAQYVELWRQMLLNTNRRGAAVWQSGQHRADFPHRGGKGTGFLATRKSSDMLPFRMHSEHILKERQRRAKCSESFHL